MINDDQRPVLTCPICQGPFKKVRQWQEVCSPVCRRKKWQLKMVRRILEPAYAKAFEELEAKIKAGAKF